jgi:hypothetical protein
MILFLKRHVNDGRLRSTQKAIPERLLTSKLAARL